MDSLPVLLDRRCLPHFLSLCNSLVGGGSVEWAWRGGIVVGARKGWGKVWMEWWGGGQNLVVERWWLRGGLGTWRFMTISDYAV